MRRFVLENGLHACWAIALMATLGSLYFSEVLGYIPCNLCWYQRILMYPLVILVGIAAVRKDYALSIYVLPMSILGAVVSIYHYTLQKTDLFKSTATACGIVPCDAQYINWFGFVTIPLLAFIAFSVISILMFAIRIHMNNR